MSILLTISFFLVKEGKEDKKITLEATFKLPANSTNQELEATFS